MPTSTPPRPPAAACLTPPTAATRPRGSRRPRSLGPPSAARSTSYSSLTSQTAYSRCRSRRQGGSAPRTVRRWPAHLRCRRPRLLRHCRRLRHRLRHRAHPPHDRPPLARSVRRLPGRAALGHRGGGGGGGRGTDEGVHVGHVGWHVGFLRVAESNRVSVGLRCMEMLMVHVWVCRRGHGQTQRSTSGKGKGHVQHMVCMWTWACTCTCACPCT